MTIDFRQKSPDINAAFAWIAKCPTGRRFLEEFLRHSGQRRVDVLPFPTELSERLRALRVPGENHGAVFVTDGVTGQIYVDYANETVVLAIFLFHEIVHALDAELWKMAKRGVRCEKGILEAERRAYAQQSRFIEELEQRYPELRAFINTHPAAAALRRHFNAAELAELYRAA
ncbi:MAG: hypothetical protein AB7P04_02700 [Bacteriovoracia bacterium]